MHIEWDVADTTGAWLMTAEDAVEELGADAPISGTHVVVLGGDGGGALAVEGTLPELCRMAERIKAEVTSEIVRLGGASASGCCGP